MCIFPTKTCTIHSPLTANTISDMVYLDMLQHWGCCHSLVTTFLIISLPAKLGTTPFALGCNSVSGILPTHKQDKSWGTKTLVTKVSRLVTSQLISLNFQGLCLHTTNTIFVRRVMERNLSRNTCHKYTANMGITFILPSHLSHNLFDVHIQRD
jgi:hypothetical protein